MLLPEFGDLLLQGVDPGGKVLQCIGLSQASVAREHCREGQLQLAWLKKVTWVFVHHLPFKGVTRFRLSLIDLSSDHHKPISVRAEPVEALPGLDTRSLSGAMKCGALDRAVWLVVDRAKFVTARCCKWLSWRSGEAFCQCDMPGGPMATGVLDPAGRAIEICGQQVDTSGAHGLDGSA